jgi:glycosyltransferase involved in cell wall biosynthesis
VLIDFVSQRYNWHSFSIVRSVFEGLQAAGHQVRDRSDVPAQTDAAIVIVASSFVALPKTNVPLIVLGLSDPAYYNEKRSTAADLYVTLSRRLSLEHSFPWMPPWGDPRYFVPGKSAREADCVFLGVGNHPWVPERRKMAAELRAAGIRLLVFGGGWPQHKDNHSFVQGKDLIEAYRSAKVLVDFSNGSTSISSRIFQSMLCGTPVLTADRPDVRRLFHAGREIAVFTRTCLVARTKRLLSRPAIRATLADAGRLVCLERHCTEHRIKALIEAVRSRFPQVADAL